jgi:hypothetical protein
VVFFPIHFDFALFSFWDFLFGLGRSLVIVSRDRVRRIFLSTIIPAEKINGSYS